MKLTDIITLAKQGFTATDIKELLAAKEEEPPKETEVPEKAESKPDEPKGEEPELTGPTTAEEIAALKAQVKELQAKKVKEPIEPPKKEEFNEDELLTNFFK